MSATTLVCVLAKVVTYPLVSKDVPRQSSKKSKWPHFYYGIPLLQDFVDEYPVKARTVVKRV